jgi:hypothetical protein
VLYGGNILAQGVIFISEVSIVVPEQFTLLSDFGVFAHEISALGLDSFEFFGSIFKLRVESLIFQDLCFVLDNELPLPQDIDVGDAIELKLHFAEFFFEFSFGLTQFKRPGFLFVKLILQ